MLKDNPRLLRVLYCLSFVIMGLRAQDYYLEGVKPSPLEHQQWNRKPSSYNSKGIQYASFNGGTSIYIRGNGFTTTNKIYLKSEVYEKTILAPPLSEEDIYLSSPKHGILHYRLPSLVDLMDVPTEFLKNTQVLNFIVLIENSDG